MTDKKPELIWALGIPSLTGGVLESRGVSFVHQLLTYSESELSAMPRIGKKGIEAIKQGLAERDLSLRSE